MSKTCYIMIGAPATGKTTWFECEPIANINADIDVGYASSDAIIEEIADEYNLTYNEAFKNLIGFADQVYWNDIVNHGRRGTSHLYIDRTNMSKKTRKKVIDILKPYGYTFEALVFNPPADDEWQRRLISRPGKNIPQGVIDNMLRNFEYPTLDEGFSSIKEI